MDNKIVEEQLLVGVDVGSTTTKIVALDTDKKEIVYSEYRRHNASQLKSVCEALERLKEKFHKATIRIAFSGSGSKLIAEKIKVPFIQEVVANSIALKKLYKNVGTAIELGGQDAKIIFFHKDEKTDDLNVSDMRMNGSCAGGTGAFIDEIATLLKVPVEKFDELAKQGNCVYDISDRCGVYAKTDIQPLLNQGAAKSDLALSTFHAIAKQTIGGLAQGLDIKSPVVFEGGPLTFHTTLVKVFKERLQLSEEEVLLPKQPEIMIAFGAALSLETMFADDTREFAINDLIEALNDKDSILDTESQKGQLYFASKEEYLEFKKRHAASKPIVKKFVKGEKIQAYLGIDSGSTTTKFILMNQKEELIDTFYAPNEGEPLSVVKNALINIRESYKKAGVELEILAVGTTGYGEMLFAKALDAESHVVETVAHARAVEKYIKDATFILDIGGQDMKAMWLQNGIITNIVLSQLPLA